MFTIKHSNTMNTNIQQCINNKYALTVIVRNIMRFNDNVAVNVIFKG